MITLSAWHQCSIKTRVTVVASTIMMLLCTAVTLMVLLTVHAYGLETRKEAMTADSVRIIKQMLDNGPASALPETPGSAAQLFSPTWKLVASTRNAAGAPPMAGIAPEPAAFATREACDLPAFPGQCAIVLDHPVHLQDGTWRLHMAAPQPPPYGSTALLGGLIGGSLLLIAVTALGTYRMMRKTLQPLQAISGKLAAIRPSNLGERVPLPKYHDELEDLAQTTNRTLERADTAVQQQLRFASDASHDLRSPLTAMRTEIEDALMQPEETDWPKTADRLLDSVERLQELVTDLLQISRLDAGVSGRHDLLNLAVLVAGELDHRPPGEVRVVRKLSSGVMINGERIGLSRLLNNLMDNAERHARSTVMVTVEHRPHAAVLEVADDGDGVPPDQREVIFQRFARLRDARARDAGGSGLGLPIARQIAETHGGTLTVEDSPRGSRFVALFPNPER